MTQRTKFKIVVYVILAVILLAVLIWLFVYDLAKIRDYNRLADMRLAQAEIIDYFLKFNTYQVAGCTVGSLLNFCAGRDGFGDQLERLADPLNKDGYQYIISDMSADNFRLDFFLEVGAGGLSAGNYSITKSGFGRPTEQ
jgi:type II secretory pathway pseudopilin PulG